ncbi:7044_t:CDS:10 [Diversispora eburnea]|uniref:7044_t:CDS:1 n=1 Tax=Diversispora eburnea TaxID=1213867 RepID=A0A9N9G0Q0_9GLOM|nr:7044_t:CDS:10 [Diversispora eburnea]
MDIRLREPMSRSEKSMKPKVSENIKKIKEQLVQHKECVLSLEQKLGKMKTQVDTLNRENEIFQQVAQQFRSEVEQLKKELAQKNDLIIEHASLKTDLKRIRTENDKLGKRINSLEVLKSQLELKIQEGEVAINIRESQEKEITHLKNELEKKEEQFKKDQSDKAIIDSKIIKLQRDFSTTKIENTRLLKELGQQNKEVLNLQNQNTEIERLKNETKNLQQKLNDSKDLQQKLNDSKKQVSTLQRENREILNLKKQNSEIERLKIGNKDLQQKLNDSQKQVVTLRHEINLSSKASSQSKSDTDQRVSVLIEKIQSMKQDIENLETQKRALQDLVTVQQVELLKSQQSKKSELLSQVNEIERFYNKSKEFTSQDSISKSSMQTSEERLSESIASGKNVQILISKKDSTKAKDNLNKSKRNNAQDTVLSVFGTTKNNTGLRKRKATGIVSSSSTNSLLKKMTQSKKRKIDNKAENKSLKAKVSFDRIDDLDFIKETINNFRLSSQDSLQLMDILRQFAYEKSSIFLQAIDELLHNFDTPIYLDSENDDDILRNFTREGAFLIQIPTVLLDKVFSWANEKTLLAGINSDEIFDLGYFWEKTNYQFIQYLFVNVARIWPVTLKITKSFYANPFPLDELFILRTIESIVARIFIERMREETIHKMYNTFIQCCSWTEPHQVLPLKEILQNLADILQSEEFHDRCSKEYFQDQFQEYRFNLVKSCELAATWWRWDDVFERFIGQILWPLVKDEKGNNTPLEIIGEVCRPRLSEREDKMGVVEIRERITLSLDECCPVSFTLQVQAAQVLVKLANGNPRYYQDVLSWYLNLEKEKSRQLSKSFTDDLEYIQTYIANYSIKIASTVAV